MIKISSVRYIIIEKSRTHCNFKVWHWVIHDNNWAKWHLMGHVQNKFLEKEVQLGDVPQN
jgi:hypothetical protein